MEIARSLKPVIRKVHRLAVAGGSNIALRADKVFMAEDAKLATCRTPSGAAREPPCGCTAWGPNAPSACG